MREMFLLVLLRSFFSASRVIVVEVTDVKVTKNWATICKAIKLLARFHTGPVSVAKMYDQELFPNRQMYLLSLNTNC